MSVRYDPIPYDHLVVPQGATFRASWTLDDADTGEPADWDGWSGRMQIRDNEGGLLATFASQGSADGSLIFAADGNVTVTLPADFSATLTPGYGVFDLKLTDPDGSAWRVVQGGVQITQAVTV